jgi:hypothetical protein
MVACPVYKCAAGSHFEILPGQCCGTCVADPKSCDVGMKEYEMNRQALFDKYSSGYCQTDGECAIAPEVNQCVARCGVALPSNTIGNWESNLANFAMQSCSACPKPFIPPCAAQFPRCMMNRCVLLGVK